MSNFLIVAGKPSSKTWRYLKQKNPEKVIGIDNGADYLIKKNIFMDFVVGDFDNMSSTSRGRIDKYSRDITYLSPEKDITDLEYAIKKTEETKDIIYAYVPEGRIDHLLNQTTLLLKYPNLRIIGEKYELQLITPGMKNSIKQERYHFFGLKPVVNTTLTIKGAKYDTTKMKVTTETSSLTSNEWGKTSDEVEISISTGKIILVKNLFA